MRIISLLGYAQIPLGAKQARFAELLDGRTVSYGEMFAAAERIATHSSRPLCSRGSVCGASWNSRIIDNMNVCAFILNLVENKVLKRFEEADAYINMDRSKIMHFPGFSTESAELLVRRCRCSCRRIPDTLRIFGCCLSNPIQTDAKKTDVTIVEGISQKC